MQGDVRVEKNRLRQAMRAWRDAFGGEARVKAEAAMLAHFDALTFYRAMHTVLCYAAIGSEAGTKELIRQLRADGKRVCLPVVGSGAPRMRAVWIDDDTRYAPGPWGIMEPEALRDRLVAPGEMDAIVFPGLAFDRRGMRLGYGKGYFDEFAAQARQNCHRIGWCFSGQIMNEVPSNASDVPMTCFVSENGIWMV